MVLKIEFFQRCGNFHKQVYFKSNHFYFCKTSDDCLEFCACLFIYCAKFRAKVVHVEIGFNLVQLPAIAELRVDFVHLFILTTYPNVHFTSVFMCFPIRLRKLMFISFQGRILIYQLRGRDGVRSVMWKCRLVKFRRLATVSSTHKLVGLSVDGQFR